MNSNALLLFLFLSVLMSELSNAQEFQSYKELRSAITERSHPLLNETATKEADALWAKGTEKDKLIKDQLNRNWKEPELKQKLEMTRPFNSKSFSEGTGSRGGGSGVLIKGSGSMNEVQILDVFRSENRAQYDQFFPIDRELRQIEMSNSAEKATQLIFENVLSRIANVAPNFGSKIQQLYSGELSFEKWVPVFNDLPLIEDEIQFPLEKNQSKIQVAFRRTNIILYSSRAYAAMRPLSRAALWLHEYLYALSSSENSVRTQRAVSLFFSADFLVIANDVPKLTLLFNELDLLAISRKTIAGSLPPGASVVGKKRVENCGMMMSLEATKTSESVVVSIRLKGASGIRPITLSRAEASIVMSAIGWSVNFLTKAFPIFKYPGQRTLPNFICLNSDQTKIVQTQSALAIDDEMTKATQSTAFAEMEYYKAQGRLAEARETHAGKGLIEELEIKTLEARQDFLREEKIFGTTLITPIDKLIYPKILGEYVIDINY